MTLSQTVKKHEYEKNIFYVSCPLVVCNGTSTGQC